MYQNACKMPSPPIGLMIIKHWSMDLPVFGINFGAQNFNFVLKNLGFFSHLCGFLCKRTSNFDKYNRSKNDNNHS